MHVGLHQIASLFLLIIDTSIKTEMALAAALALSGLNEEQFGKDLKPIYEPGAKLLKSPSSSSIASATSTISSYHSMESGIASLSNESSKSPSISPETCWEMLTKLEDFILAEDKKYEDLELPALRPIPASTNIKWEKRNLLDLGSNLKVPNLVTYAELPKGPIGFLENRSQYSRLDNVFAKPKEITICFFCEFKEYKY